MTTTEPKRIIMGDTVQWSKSISGYDPDTWTLTYGFANATQSFVVEGVAQLDGTWLVRLSPAETAALTAGKYRYQARVSDGADVFTVIEQPIGEFTEVVGAVPSGGGGLDLRHQLERDLEAIEAFLAGKSDVASYTIRDRSLARYSHAELWAMRQELKRAIAEERKAARIEAGLGTSGKVRVRFVR